MTTLITASFIQPILAQEGSRAAVEVIERSLQLSRAVAASWDQTWQMLLEGGDLSLWSAIVTFSVRIAILALIYYVISQANEVMNTQSFSKIIEMFFTPLVVIFLLGGNGYILANIILMIRGVGRSLILDILQLQAGGIRTDEAINQVSTNVLAQQRIRQIFQECASLTGEPLNQCIESKQQEAQTIVDLLGQGSQMEASQNLLDLISDATALGSIQGIFTQVIQSTAVPVLQTLLFALQWAFVNLSEAALLLSALFAPVAVALMLFPVAGSVLSIWFCSFVGILAIQLGYVLLVGFSSAVLVMADERQSAIAAAGDYGFLVFISIFAPYLAVAIGKGGGEQLYHGISQRVAAVAQSAVQVVAVSAKLAAGVF